MRIAGTDVVRRVRGTKGTRANGWQGGRAMVPKDVEAALTNISAYILSLEYGHSDQAPNGMVRINMPRIRTIARQALREALRTNSDPQVALQQAITEAIMAADFFISEATPVDTGYAKVQWTVRLPRETT